MTALADKLCEKLRRAIDELDVVTLTGTRKTTTADGDDKVVTEEHTQSYGKGCIDRSGLKTLTSALKELRDITEDDGEGETYLHVCLSEDAEDASL